jgi:hypothetical protein
MVPLANAWRSGASSAAWSTSDREAYANDPEVLLSTVAGANRAQGAKGPQASWHYSGNAPRSPHRLLLEVAGVTR